MGRGGRGLGEGYWVLYVQKYSSTGEEPPYCISSYRVEGTATVNSASGSLTAKPPDHGFLISVVTTTRHGLAAWLVLVLVV